MTAEEIKRFAESWAEEHQGIGIGLSLPQILGQFGQDLIKFAEERLSEIIFESEDDGATQK